MISLYSEDQSSGQISQGPADDKISVIVAVQITMTVIALILLLIRLYTRGALLHSFGVDDGLIILSWLFSLASCLAILYACAHTGLGQHNRFVKDSEVLAWNSIQLHVTWIAVYALVFVRLSIITFYLRISPKKGFQWSCYTLMMINVVWAITVLIVDMTTCVPARRFWMPEVQGTCRDPIPFNIFAGIFNIVLDLTTYLLPMPMLRHLQMNRKQRIGLQVTFGIGLIAVVAGGIRIPYLFILMKSRDYMYEQWGIVVWSAIELNLGIVGACIPALKALLRKVLPSGSNPYRSYGRRGGRIGTSTFGSFGGGGTLNEKPSNMNNNNLSVKTNVSRWEADEEMPMDMDRVPKGGIVATTEIRHKSEPVDGVDSVELQSLSRVPSKTSWYSADKGDEDRILSTPRRYDAPLPPAPVKR